MYYRTYDFKRFEIIGWLYRLTDETPKKLIIGIRRQREVYGRAVLNFVKNSFS